MVGLLKCLMRRDDVGALWQNVGDGCRWETLEPDANALSGS